MKSKNFEDLLNGDANALIARKIILGDTFSNLDGKGITPQSKLHVHAVIIGLDSLTIAIARQIALVAHYPNFNDETGENRSRITIIQENIETKEQLEECKLRLDDALGKLLDESICSLIGKDGYTRNRDKSFIDLEFEIIGLHSQSYKDYLENSFITHDGAIVSLFVRDGIFDDRFLKNFDKNYYQVCMINDASIMLSEQDKLINVQKARKVNMIYQAGTYLNQINVNDIADVKSYATALSTFAYHNPLSKEKDAWAKLKDISLKLSNVYCADCFNIRLRSVNNGKDKLQDLVEKNLESLARSEHARWNTEKLILGYRPLTPEELYNDELLYNDDVTRYRSFLKKQHVHINLCTYKNLLRLDPESIKYDCFLMLAMTEINKM